MKEVWEINAYEKGYNLISCMRHFNLEITRRCNQRCFYCFNNSGYYSLANELNLKEWKSIIDQISLINNSSILITGGEPLLHPKFTEIVSHALNCGISTSILSNGFRISELIGKHKNLFKKIKVVQISLDSMNNDKHNLRRGHPNAFYDAISAIESLTEIGVPIEISTAIDHDNISDLIEICEYCVSISARLILRPLIITGRASKIKEHESFYEKFNLVKSQIEKNYYNSIIEDRFCYVGDKFTCDQYLINSTALTVDALGKIRSNLLKDVKVSNLLVSIVNHGEQIAYV